MNNTDKPQFSKVWLAVCIAVSLIFTAASYLLAVFDKEALSGLTSELIRTLWGASGTSFVGYIIQNSVRAYTSSKYGIPEQDGGEDIPEEPAEEAENAAEEENGDIYE